MKKFGFFLILILAAGGFLYWYMLPNQQLKRKSQRILDAFTVEPGNDGGLGGVLSAESLFDRQVRVKLASSSILFKAVQNYTDINLISQETLIAGIQQKGKVMKLIQHSVGPMKVTQISESSYHVEFHNTVTAEFSKYPVKGTEKFKITFAFEDKSDGFKLTEVTLTGI